MAENKVEVCAKEPCPDCPWRISNRRRRSPVLVEGQAYGWFSQKNQQRLWAALRRGEAMTCHPTDPNHHENSSELQVRECAGAVILQQRELMIVQALMKQNEDKPGRAWGLYLIHRPLGLTKEAAFQLMWNAVYGSVPLLGGRDVGKPDLNNEDVGHRRLEWPVSFVPMEV